MKIEQSREMTSDKDNDKVQGAIVGLAIEKALLELGPVALEEVTDRLFDCYHCKISDCFEKPEYIKKVLKDLYGNSYTVILESIKKYLEKFDYQIPIQTFLKAIS